MLEPRPIERKRPSNLEIAIIVALCGAPALRGQAATTDKVESKAHYESATRLYDVREYDKALEEYKAAYLAKPDPAFLFNIGQCYRKLGKNPEALDFFRQYLKKAPAEDPNRAQVEARILELEGERATTPDTSRTAATGGAASPPSPAVAPPPQPSPTQATAFPAGPNPPAGQPAGVDLTASAPASNEGTSKPIYRTWWFWTGVGVAVAAGAATAIVLSSRGGGSNVPDGLSLGSAGVLP